MPGALVRASVALGARCSNAVAPGRLAHLDHYAKCVGLAFQVVDDVLDQESSTATLGKTSGKDAANNKPTYVSALGLPDPRPLTEQMVRQRQAALFESPGVPETPAPPSPLLPPPPIRPP